MRMKISLQRCSKKWFLGCVNSRPTARGSQEAGFTQPKNDLLEHICIREKARNWISHILTVTWWSLIAK